MRLISMLLACVILLSTASCSPAETVPVSEEEQISASQDEEKHPEETEEIETNKYDIEKMLPSADYGGRDFRISCTDLYTYEMYVEEMTGEVCNDAIFNRNQRINELYNVNIIPVITAIQSRNEDHVDEVKKNLLAGENLYDLTAIYTYVAQFAVLAWCFHDWKNIPIVDFSADWWIKSANEAFTIGDSRYVAVGDLCITTLLFTYVYYYNRNIAQNFNLPDLYDLVKEGKWTVDKVTELTGTMYQDTNGSGVVEQTDFFGLAAQTVTSLDAYPAAFDITLIGKDADNYPVLDLDMDRMMRGIEKVYKLYYNNNNATFCHTGGEEVSTFTQGRSLFLTQMLQHAYNALREMEDDYGILPYPKLDEQQQEYHVNSMDNYSLLSVPVTIPESNLEFVGHIVEALNIESKNSVFPAYYEIALTDKYARDTESVEMLDIIMDSRTYDFSILHAHYFAQLPYMFRNLLREQSTDFASAFAASKTKMETGLKSLLKEYAALGND